MKILKQFFVLCLFALLIGCSKDDDTISPLITSANGVYIINEGNFMKSNSSLSYYSIDSGKVYNDIFSTVNNKKLGDVAQNMYIKDSKGYIIVNNSNKIVVIDIVNNKLLDTITTHLISPRSIVFSDNNMYVSNLYGSTISVFSGENYKTFVKDIPVKANPDEMIILNGKIYCCHSSAWDSPSTTLSIITVSNSTVKTIKIGYNPTMIKAANNFVVILCSGEYNDYANPNDDIFAKLYLLNPDNDLVTDSLLVGGHPMDFVVDKLNNAYITGDNAIIKADLKTKAITNTALISGSFYSIGYESINNELYLGNAKNYTTNGEVSIYSMTGQLNKKFEVGLIPGAFCFK